MSIFTFNLISYSYLKIFQSDPQSNSSLIPSLALILYFNLNFIIFLKKCNHAIKNWNFALETVKGKYGSEENNISVVKEKLENSSRIKNKEAI